MRIIKILTDEDVKGFNRAAPKHEIVMAGFFMVNCPACKAFKPEWDKFVDSCESQEEPKVLIAEIDSNQASRVNFDTSALEGFPTVYRDVKGEEGVVEFKQERTKKALRRFLKEAMAAKGGRKKRRKKRKTKKRRKSRKKKKGGDQSHCVQASENPRTKTEEEGNAYCLKYGGQGKPKCDINTGLCIPPPPPPPPLPANIRYIDPQDIPPEEAIPPPIPLHRTRNLHTSSSPPSLRQNSGPLGPIPLSGDLKPPPLVRSPARQSHQHDFQFGTFTPEELGAMTVLRPDSDSDLHTQSDNYSDDFDGEEVDGGYKKRKKRRKTRKKRKNRKKRRKRRTKRKRR